MNKLIKNAVCFVLIASVLAGCSFKSKEEVTNKKDNTNSSSDAPVNKHGDAQVFEIDENTDVKALIESMRNKHNEIEGDKRSKTEVDKETRDFVENTVEKDPDYRYLRIAYFLDDEGTPRNSYVPYGRGVDINHYNDLTMVSSGHIGVAVANTMFSDVEDAREVLEFYEEDHDVDKTLMFLADNDTVGVLYTYGVDEDGDDIIDIYYADIRDDGKFYYVVMISLFPEYFEKNTLKMIDELKEVLNIKIMPTSIEEVQKMIKNK